MYMFTIQSFSGEISLKSILTVLMCSLTPARNTLSNLICRKLNSVSCSLEISNHLYTVNISTCEINLFKIGLINRYTFFFFLKKSACNLPLQQFVQICYKGTNSHAVQISLNV